MLVAGDDLSMSFFRDLSNRQHVWLIGTVIAMIAIVVVGWSLEPKDEEIGPFSRNLTIRQIAPQIGTTGFAIAKELRLSREVDKDTPLAELGIEQTELDEVTAHLLSHRGRTVKYYVFAALSLFGFVWLTRLGRPDGSPNSERTAWYPRAPYIAALLLAVVVCGFALGKSPNPMEGAVKLFKGMVGLQPSISAVVFAFAFFVGLAIVGNKLICGWACPFGALQELFYSLPVLNRLKRKKVPHGVSNTIRGGLFVLMLLILFGLVGGKKGFVIYHFVNPFNLFNLRFESPTILLTVVVTLVAALAIYRPFCQLLCPFGFVSWLAERISLVRVRVDLNRCNACGACARACPTQSAEHTVNRKIFGADCYSCARCLNVCPEEAIAYRCALGSSVSETDSVAELSSGKNE
ncbi:MAG TPA: 4Fe-4S binding protein [Thermoguttaceae bacterium]|nr:4Fe-4S binding protein [Thermoguttaceae bacterium]